MINIKIENKTLFFYGNINKVPKDIFIYFDSKGLKVISQTEDSMEYKYEIEEKDLIMILEKVFRHYNVSYSFSESIKKQQEDYFVKEKQFKEFTEKARKIRNNECNKEEFEQFKKSLEKNMPERTLYGLQFLSAYHMAFSQNACNFSVPGAGKTSIVYGAYTYLKNLSDNNEKKVNKILIIGPLNSFGPWEEEYKSCFGKEVDSKRIVGMDKKEREKYFQGHLHSEITLVSYPTAAFSVEDIIVFLKNERVMVVLDEAHKIKNSDIKAQIAPAILKMANYAWSKIILTGTPAPNGYLDLYNLYNFIWPDRNIIKFSKSQLFSMSKPNATQSQKSMIQKLINDIEPFFIRIKKNDFNDMPIPNENPLIEVEMDDMQEKIYCNIEKNILNKINTSIELSSFTKAKIIRLMQAASNPLLLKKPLNDLKKFDIDFSDIELLNLIN